MFEIRKTDVFARWIDSLKDLKGRSRVLARLDRLADGPFGDTKAVGNGVAELRIHHGPGYRVYFTKRRQTLVVLLCGGKKSSQSKDIQRAVRLAEELPE